MAPPNNGRFRKGHDPRRHKFTTEECRRGFWAAIESIATRHPDWIDPSGRHACRRFLKKRRKTK